MKKRKKEKGEDCVSVALLLFVYLLLYSCSSYFENVGVSSTEPVEEKNGLKKRSAFNDVMSSFSHRTIKENDSNLKV